MKNYSKRMSLILAAVTMGCQITVASDSVVSVQDNLLKANIGQLKSTTSSLIELADTIPAEEYLNYQVLGDVISILGVKDEYKAIIKDVVIPKEIDGMKVTTIAVNAFRGEQTGVDGGGNPIFAPNVDLESVVIPSTMVSINADAFNECINLHTVVMESDPGNLNGVGTIQKRVFQNCKSLVNVVMSPNVKRMSNGAFRGCSALETIELPNTITKMDPNVFTDCTNLKTVNIPNKLTSIPAGTFWNCKALENIIIPESIKTIERQAFHGCNLLKEVDIPNQVTLIGGSAFSGCFNLIELVIPESVEQIQEASFEDASKVETLDMPPIEIIGEKTFRGMNALKKLTINYYDNTILDKAYPEFTSQVGYMDGLEESQIEVGYLSSNESGNTETKLVRAILNPISKDKFYFKKDAVISLPEVTLLNDDMGKLHVMETITDDAGNIVEDIDTSIDGRYTVTYNAADSKFNKAGNVEGTIKITVVVDTKPPVLDYTGDDTIHVNQGGSFEPPIVNATDNEDGDVKVDYIIKDSEGNVVDKVDTSKPGDYTITYEAEDEAGNKSEQDVVITVVVDEDKEPPKLENVPSDQVIKEDDSWTPPNVTATDDQDKDVEVELVITDEYGNVVKPEDTKKPGKYTYTYTAKDDAGNTAVDSFTVTVEESKKPDITPPVISGVPEDMNIQVGEDFTLPNVTATDNQDKDIEVELVITDEYGNVVKPEDTKKPGKYTYTYTAKDDAGNTAVDSFTVTVEQSGNLDTIAPVIDGVPEDMNIQVGEDFIIPNVTAQDNIDGKIEPELVITDRYGNVVEQVDTTRPGEYTYTYTAKDKSGNESKKEFTITVENEEAPKLNYEGDTDLTTKQDNIFTVPSITVEDDKDSDIEIDVIIKDSQGNVVGKYENVKPGDKIILDQTGDYTITYEAEDKDGNKSESVTVRVNVTDKESDGYIGVRPSGSTAIDTIIDSLSKEEKDEIEYNLNNWIPYTTLHSNLTLEQLDKLTLNKFTEAQLKEILERSEFMDKLGAERDKMSKQITLKTIEDVKFGDVSDNHWGRNVIKLGAELGIIAGMPNGTFEPKTSLKVEDTFTFLDRVLLLNGVLEMDLTRTQVEKYFNDKDHWAFFNVASVSSKLTEETLETVHALGNGAVTRELLAQVLYDILNGTPVSSLVAADFTDIAGTKYETAINYCLDKGLLVGMTKTTMEPDRAITRAELIGVLMRLHEFLSI